MEVGNLNVMGYPIFNGNLEEMDWSANKLLVNTLNQYSYYIAHRDEAFEKALKDANIWLPDGVGIIWAAKWLKGKRIKKIAGVDSHAFFYGTFKVLVGVVFTWDPRAKYWKKSRIVL